MMVSNCIKMSRVWKKKLDLGNYHELDFSFSSCNILFDLISNLIT